MSVTIDSLDIQIRSSAGSAKQKIEELAKALDKLSGMESVKRIISALNKLPQPAEKGAKAIKKLDSANKSATKSTNEHGNALKGQRFNLLAYYENLSNVFSMLHGVQDAAAKVMNDAIQWDGIQFRFGRAFAEDAEMVLEYAEKVSEELRINQQQFMQYSSLYASLLSGFGMEQEQITTISVGLTELSYDIWAAYNDRYKTLEEASEAIRSAITGEIEPIRNAGIALTEASMKEYAEGYDAAAAAANDTVTAFESLQQSADEATGAVTDMLGNGISKEAMQATADMLGLGMSVENMTEAQKSELRYAVMVNSAMQQGIVGTYAKEMDTAEGVVRTFTQQLKTLGQAIGSLFLPILVKVVPWISAFVELLTEGLIALGAMFGIEFQEIKWGDASGMKQTAEGANATADALGDAAKNAKKMMDYTMGFDELNVINPPSKSSGSSGAGGSDAAGGGSLGLDLDTLWDKSVFASASKQIDELKEKIKTYAEEHKAMLIVVGSVTAFFTLAKTIRMVNNLLGITKTWSAIVAVFTKLGAAVTGIKEFFAAAKLMSTEVGWLAALFPKISSAVTSVVGVFSKLGGVIAAFVGGLSAPAIAGIMLAITGLVSILVFLKRNWEEVTAAVKGFFATNIAPMIESIKKSFEKMGFALKTLLPDNVVQAFKDVGSAIAEWFASVPWLEAIGNAFEWLGGILFSVLGGVLAGVVSGAVKLIDGLIRMLAGVVEFISGVVEFVVAIFTGGSVARPLAKMLVGIFDLFVGLYNATIGVVVNFVKGIIDWFTELWDELVGHSIVPDMIEAIIEWFLSLPGKILQPVKNFCDNVKNAFITLWNGVKSWWNSNVAPKFTIAYWKNKFDVIRQAIASKLDEFKQAAADKWKAITNWFTTNIAPKFTLKFWLDKFANLKTGFTTTIKNAVNAGIDLMNKFIGWINSHLGFSWDAIKIAGKEIVPAGNIQLFTIPSIPRLETGGFLEDGLFTMNRGEIAGKFNNGKSVVANNQQIVEGIAAGVYGAVVAAMNATSGNSAQSVNVYLDGKQITAAVERRQSERGLSLMGNQLGYV